MTQAQFLNRVEAMRPLCPMLPPPTNVHSVRVCSSLVCKEGRKEEEAAFP